MKSMKVMAPWLSILITSVAMLPQEAYCEKRLPQSHSPIISPPLARYRCTSCFIHRPSTNRLHCTNAESQRIEEVGACVMPFHQSAKSSVFRLSMSSPQQSSTKRWTSSSPWSPGEWKITLDFGKKEESSEKNGKSQLANLLGKEWGSNGGRLALSFDVLVTSDIKNGSEDKNKSAQAWLGGKPTGTVQCISHTASDDVNDCASYINEGGQQYVKISAGQWRIEPPLPILPSYTKIIPGQASTLRFYLTLATAVQRNTIIFPEKQLLLLQSNAFRTQQYLSGITTLLPYRSAMESSQILLEERLNHDTGDRRLDGNDIFETLGGYRDIAELVTERDSKS
ncbi:hypothetical protein ACHAW5_009679 [Stephanodiscus triporus]|uniref:Uncharacterized protein n=1 Tax=Stephanodiscus triporus TaxID=2934178 RepID=A0ABD3NHP0_9STRA